MAGDDAASIVLAKEKQYTYSYMYEYMHLYEYMYRISEGVNKWFIIGLGNRVPLSQQN